MSSLVDEDTASTLKWVKSFNRVPKTTPIVARLLCFHWAGGNGMVFRPWALSMASLGIDVLAMHCPGRLQRIREPNVENVALITESVYKSLKLQGLLESEVPLLLFGHSLGSLIAFELAKRIEKDYPDHSSSLKHLLMSSINNPSVLLQKYADPESIELKKHLLGDDEFIKDMSDLGGTAGVADELIRMALPVIRADFKALETYRPQPWAEGQTYEDAIDNIIPEHMCCTPLTILGGYKDHFVTADASIGWFKFIVGGPPSPEEVQPIFCPDTGSTTTLPTNQGNFLCGLPPFRLFMDKEGTHFTLFDKENRAGAWGYEIIVSTCKQCHIGTASDARVV